VFEDVADVVPVSAAVLDSVGVFDTVLENVPVEDVVVEYVDVGDVVTENVAESVAVRDKVDVADVVLDVEAVTEADGLTDGGLVTDAVKLDVELLVAVYEAGDGVRDRVVFERVRVPLRDRV
jgi:hypothetical protein